MDLNTLFPTGMSHFAVGGLLIGLGISLIFVTTGIVAGASSVFSSSWSFFSNQKAFNEPSMRGSRDWRLVFAVASIAGAFLMSLFLNSDNIFSSLTNTVTQVPAWQLLVGGIIAGFGARYGNGCTSGHGICGIASLSVPSLFAVITFLTTAIITAQLMSTFLPNSFSGIGGGL